MFVKYFDATTPKYFLFRNQSKRHSIPRYHILILAWCALVILLWRNRPKPHPRTQRKMTAFSVAYR